MSDYDTDILTWSERQADLLRRVGAGEAVNARIDWDNVAEEIESLGRSEVPVLPVAVAPGAAAHAEGRGLAAFPRRSQLAG